MIHTKISVIIPTFNEKLSLVELITRLHSTLKQTNMEYELIFVDDYSTDGTYEHLTSLKDSVVKVYRKKGMRGKAYSIQEGIQHSLGTLLVMIDSDLQYPPEAIVEMIKLTEKADVIVANRKQYKDVFIRKTMSKTFRFIFGRMLFNLNHDIQSGLKVFTREVAQTIYFTPKSAWTFDLEFLHRARHCGFKIKSYNIDFSKREKGNSNIHYTKQALEIGSKALLLRLQTINPLHIPPLDSHSMNGAGIGYKGKKYITHTTLPHGVTALDTFTLFQKIAISFILFTTVIGFISNPLLTLQIGIGILSFIYFVDTIFNLYVTMKSLRNKYEIEVTDEQLSKIQDRDLPKYSILCPLYREGHVLPKFLEALAQLEYPKNKLEVLLLLEEDDKATIDAAQKLELPIYVKTLIVPHSFPKTKPKACNYGLSHATGEYIVIFDAEDIPDPKQLKKAIIAFQKVPKNVICLQAKLNYFNPHQNILTKFFTAEYSLWFDMTLPGLQSLETSLPLGGTSNHFKTDILRKLLGWDPFNVTEDADLGVRLFRKGYRTAIINSTTLEEANSNVMNWLRQRSRWIKGYMQTYLVHGRDTVSFAQKHGHHSVIFQLVIGGKIAFILINPILWITTISYFALYQYTAPTIEALYPSYVFYMAGFSLVFGNFLFMYYYMLGCMKQGHYSLIKYVFFIPVYWFLISIAGLVALYQLIFKPHYWEKTNHGLNTSKQSVKKTIVYPFITKESTYAKFTTQARNGLSTGGLIIASALVSNIFNFLYNAYLGRALNAADFGLISLVGSFAYLSQIPLGALHKTIIYKSAYLFGKYQYPVTQYWKTTRKNTFFVSLALTCLWIISIPMLSLIFKSDDYLPFILFTPIWIVGFVSAVDGGYLAGNHKFNLIAALTVIESISKFIFAYILVNAGLHNFVYSAVPLSIILSFIIGWYAILTIKSQPVQTTVESLKFPKQYYFSSVLNKFSIIAFLSFDVILAKLYLSPEDAGHYALLSLVGKMTFFLGSLFSQFIDPFIGKAEGAGKKSEATFHKLVLLVLLSSTIGFMTFGALGHITVPILFGEKAEHIVHLLPLYSFAMVLFSFGSSIAAYKQIKKHYLFSAASFLIAGLEIAMIIQFHNSVETISIVMVVISLTYLSAMTFLYVNYEKANLLLSNLLDFLQLFDHFPKDNRKQVSNLRILILNWRDTKHAWAGGAEIYIHELAKRWAKEGNKVTVFCGNDGKSPRNQLVDNVQVVRRGGTYTVYFWAFIYYMLRFRGNFDVIIDCENGIPFFTPLYARIPVFLLIHHIHQDVFRKQLIFPLSYIGKTLEAKIMPVVYKNKQIITVSESSRREIQKLGFAKNNPIQIVNPGIDSEIYKLSEKTEHPSFAYIGRLKPYKNIDTAIKAFKKVIEFHPKATFTIAGEGESMKQLKQLTKDLGMEDSVEFLGKIKESEKPVLLGKSWVVLQPSMVEGWGITVIEANASGTAVIASDVHGLRDSIVHGITGVLVEVGSDEKFAKAMTEFVIDKQYRNYLSKQAHIWSLHFSWEQSSKRFFQIIIESVNNKTSYNLGARLAWAKGTYEK